MPRVRFDPELLDPDEPFQIDDGNRPHLAKHSPYTQADIFDAWADPDLLFAEAAANGPADWLLIAALPGGDVVQVPLAPGRNGEWRRCRPIGIYDASYTQWELYQQERKR
jgi:hypothetical protein